MFTARTVSYSIYWRLHHREPIERWMPIGYIAHSYDVPPDVLERALGMPERRPPARPDRRPIGDIATSQGKSFDEVKATLQNAIANWKPPPPPDKSGDPPPPPADRAGP